MMDSLALETLKSFHYCSLSRKYHYHAQEQRLPVLIGEGQDFMVKIKVLSFAA